jgi:probable F420-dependent oxidoreductase
MRQVGRLGVWYPVDRLDGPGIRHLLRTVEELGYPTFWYPEALGYESLSIASFMLANTKRLIIGSSIANIYARDPFTARRGLRTLSGLYDDRFILRLGVSHAPMVERVRGHVYDKPVPTMLRYLDGLYEDPSNAAEWPVVIAALRPLMLKLAAERTAGAVPYNVTPEHTREARAALGPDKLLAVEQKVCLQTDPTAARGLARRGHCQSKFYTACSRTRAGWSSTVFAHESPTRSAGFYSYLP